jgi:L,D-peptidoglycan transpeptidase YkuD (ErfK/YbiS/YcfS/YnhG family)
VAAATCAPGLAGRLASTGSASQIVVVDAPTYDTTTATVTLWQHNGACWVAVAGPWAARIGGGGFSDHHLEGDESTPTGAYPVGSVIYGNQPSPGVRYEYHQLVCGDWWDEDPTSPQYNTFQHVACGQKPSFGGGSEALWQETAAYPSFAVIDYNASPIVPGAGSGIFLHADIGSPTAGCVSLPLSELDYTLQWLNPQDSPLIVMGPDSEITTF